MDLFKKKDPRIAELDAKIAKSASVANKLADAKIKTSNITTDSEDSSRTIKLVNSYIDAVKEYKDAVQKKMSVLNESPNPDKNALEKTLKQVEAANEKLDRINSQYSEYSKDASKLAGIQLPKINEAFGGRKRKTRKHRSRKLKKTRKH